jgi:6-phosphofructokinase 1
MRCLLATLGKDSPGVNAVLRASTRIALRRGFEVYGARRGFPGIIEGSFHRMREADAGFILGRGGSLLGSSDFRLPLHQTEALGQIAASLKRFDLVVATGGLGSFSILDRVYSFHDLGLTSTMFVPASVENEFLNPAAGGEGPRGIHAESVGADTAANTGIEAIDRLREQSYLSRTVFIIQCVGTKSNFLPMQIGVACGAHRIYLPEYPLLAESAKNEIRELFGPDFDPNRVNVKELIDWIETILKDSDKRYLVVIIPNGIPLLDIERGDDDETRRREEYERIVASSTPVELTVLRVVDDLTMHFAGDSSVQIRYVVLDDLQRGGAPTVRDRVLGTVYGQAAVEEFLAIVSGQDTARRGNLNLLAVDDVCGATWRCHPRREVAPIFQGPKPRAGGLDPMPYFRQLRGTVSGFRALAGI